MEIERNNSSSNVNNFLDCGENIKVETLKEEINEEESVVDLSNMDYYTVNNVKQEIKEEVNESDEEQGSNLDHDNLVDCSQYVQVQMNL